MNELKESLTKAFTYIVNVNSGENEANIPDFIISEFLAGCFELLNEAVRKRDEWYNVTLQPGDNKNFTANNNQLELCPKHTYNQDCKLTEAWICNVHACRIDRTQLKS